MAWNLCADQRPHPLFLLRASCWRRLECGIRWCPGGGWLGVKAGWWPWQVCRGSTQVSAAPPVRSVRLPGASPAFVPNQLIMAYKDSVAWPALEILYTIHGTIVLSWKVKKGENFVLQKKIFLQWNWKVTSYPCKSSIYDKSNLAIKRNILHKFFPLILHNFNLNSYNTCIIRSLSSVCALQSGIFRAHVLLEILTVESPRRICEATWACTISLHTIQNNS